MRLLTKDDIDVRVGSKNKTKTKAQLLLYKDARVDMAVLDELYGSGNWQDDYKQIEGVLFAGIGVWNKDIGQWVWKWSNGVESKGTGDDDTNNIKGEASDAFKRAGFMWGIGRELYNCKGIWVDIKAEEYLVFKVKEILFSPETLQPIKILIVDQDGNVRYEMGKKVKSEIKPVESVSNTTPNIDTKTQEKVVEEPKNGVKIETNANEDNSKALFVEIYQDLVDYSIDGRNLNTAFFERSNVMKSNNYADIKTFVRARMDDYVKNVLKTNWKQTEISNEPRKPIDKAKIVLIGKDIKVGVKKEIDTWLDINGITGEDENYGARG